MIGWFKRKKRDPKVDLAQILGRYRPPTFPKVVLDSLAQLRRPDVGLDRVSRLLSADPGVSVHLLKLANASAYALKREVRNVEHAVSLLGRGETEALLLTVAVKNVLPSKKQPGFDPVSFWRAAARRAATARALADVLHPATRSESFTAALLQDMALPLLLEARGAEYRAVLDDWRQTGRDLSDIESTAFGWNHAHVAGWLCEEWRFPAALSNAIGAHHEEDSSIPASVSLVAMLREETDTPSEEFLEKARGLHALAPDDVTALVCHAFEEAESLATRFTA
jgi:HD-like signal output (HDOD) protein